MENENGQIFSKDSPLSNALNNVCHQKNRQALIAFGLTFGVPLVLYLLQMYVIYTYFIFLFASLFSPAIGMLMAVSVLCRGKEEIGKTGMYLALSVLVVPVLFNIHFLVQISISAMSRFLCIATILASVASSIFLFYLGEKKRNSSARVIAIILLILSAFFSAVIFSGSVINTVPFVM